MRQHSRHVGLSNPSFAGEDEPLDALHIGVGKLNTDNTVNLSKNSSELVALAGP